jgi:hypothetical protein
MRKGFRFALRCVGALVGSDIGYRRRDRTNDQCNNEKMRTSAHALLPRIDRHIAAL